MNKLTYFTIGALVIAVITIGIIGYTVRQPVVNVQPVIELPLGAMPGNELSTEDFTVNGVRTWYLRADVNRSSTTTLCTIKLPTATSTIESFTINLTNGPQAGGSALSIDLGEGTAFGATTTVYNRVLLAATVPIALNASTTIGSSGTNGFIGGKHWLTAKMDYATSTLRGACVVRLTEID